MADHPQVTAAEIAAAKDGLRQLQQSCGVLTGCTSYLQRKMTVTYTRAAILLAHLERQGFISMADRNGERRFLLENEQPK